MRKLVDIDTGELINIHEGDKLKIISKEQSIVIQNTYKIQELNEEIKDWNEQLGGFIFVLFRYCNFIMSQYPEITPEDITKLFYLATFIDFDGYLVDDEGYITRSKMQKKLNMGRTQFDIFFNKMVKFKIFIVQNKKIIINNIYFVKGEIKTDSEFTRIYINTIRYLFENVSKRQHKRLGTFFRLIPFMHRQLNVLCWNPNSDVNKIVPIKVKDLKEQIGCHRHTARNFLKELFSIKLQNGESVIGTFKTEYDDGESYIIVNPRVFYGGNFNFKDGKEALIKWFR